MTNKWNFAVGIATALLLVAAVQLGGVSTGQGTQWLAPANAAEGSNRTITVVGEGKAAASPNLARVSVGVTTFAPTATEATKENNDKMTGIINTLKDLGIADKEIQTTNYSISPEFSSQKGETNQITGYRVSDTVQVTVHNLDKIGTVLDRVTQAGANNISGISFGIENPATLQGEARAQAFADAQARAEDLAKLGGVQLGEILSISESSGGGPVPVANALSSTAPIQPGQIEVHTQIQVIYAIQ
jgi:uncharacterized protein YggE